MTPIGPSGGADFTTVDNTHTTEEVSTEGQVEATCEEGAGLEARLGENALGASLLQDLVQAPLHHGDSVEGSSQQGMTVLGHAEGEHYEASGGAFLKNPHTDEAVLVTVNDKGTGAQSFVSQRRVGDTFEPLVHGSQEGVALSKMEDIHPGARVKGAGEAAETAFAISSFDRDDPSFQMLVKLHFDADGELRYEDVNPLRHTLAGIREQTGGFAKIEGLAVSDDEDQFFVGVRNKGATWQDAEPTCQVYGMSLTDEPTAPPKLMFEIDTEALFGRKEGTSGLFMDDDNDRLLVTTSFEGQDATDRSKDVVGGHLYAVDQKVLTGEMSIDDPGALTVLATFDEKVEGITRDPRTGCFVVVFDPDKGGQDRLGMERSQSMAAVFPSDAFE